MRLRTIEEIERAFREMGFTAEDWGKAPDNGSPISELTDAPLEVFFRIETTTDPLEDDSNADMA